MQMPEISAISLPSLTPAAPVQDTGALARSTSVAPPSTSTPEPAAPKSREALQQNLDQVLAESDTSLRFKVDDDSGRIVVSVVDNAGEVVMQIPDEAALNVARRLALTGSLLDYKA